VSISVRDSVDGEEGKARFIEGLLDQDERSGQQVAGGWRLRRWGLG